MPPPILPTPLATERLLLRPLELADAPRTQLLFPHWEIVRLLAAQMPWPYPADGAVRYYRESALPAMAEGNEWHWTLRLKTQPEEHIGAVALFRGEDNHRGFWLGAPWQLQGLMTEAVLAATDFWFGALGMPLLRAPKAAGNTGSRRLSEKTGMRLIDRFEKDFVAGRLPAELWEITADEWWRFRNS